MIQALPVRATPGIDEPWEAYLERVADAAGTCVAAVRATTGLSAPAGPGWRARIYPDADFTRAAAAALRLSAATVERMHVGCYLAPTHPEVRMGEASRSKRLAQDGNWLLPSYRACPDCLREEGRWRIAWALPWTVVCVRHRLLLMSSCPQCDAPLRAGTHSVAGSALQVRAADRCAAPITDVDRRRQACGASWTVRAVCEPASDDLVALQESVDATLRGEPMTVLGERHDSAAVLEAWRALAVAFLWLQRKHGRTPLGVFRTPPVDARVTADALTAALTVLTRADPTDAAQTVHSWFGTDRKRVTVRAYESAVPATPALAPLRDALSVLVRPPTRLPLPTSEFAAENVPQTAWPCLLPDSVTHNGYGPSTALLRATLAVAINRARTDDWGSAAYQLGWRSEDGSNWKRRMSSLDRTQRAAMYAAADRGASALAAAADLPIYPHQPLRVGRTVQRLSQAAVAHCATSGGAWCPCVAANAYAPT